MKKFSIFLPAFQANDLKEKNLFSFQIMTINFCLSDPLSSLFIFIPNFCGPWQNCAKVIGGLLREDPIELGL